MLEIVLAIAHGGDPILAHFSKNKQAYDKHACFDS
jgi:hypothetical protein